ncbi:MAG: hypothetical protein ABIR36_11460 [Nitrospiraceae bacterium]
MDEHNGYIQINLLAPHATEQYFNGEIFLNYASHESPPEALRIVREELGVYAPSIIDIHLVPWGRDLAMLKPVPFSIPTPGVTPRLFPFDSPTFDFSLRFMPPRIPKVVLVRNLTSDFIPLCETFLSKWDGAEKLTVRVSYRRNPFVQATVVIIGLGALSFGLLLGLIKGTEGLTIATASYFFSIWSVRSIIAPTGLAYPTLLDFWLMFVCMIVLFVVAWRLTSIEVTGVTSHRKGKGSRTH